MPGDLIFDTLMRRLIICVCQAAANLALTLVIFWKVMCL
jgi:hypothetical protein